MSYEVSQENIAYEIALPLSCFMFCILGTLLQRKHILYTSSIYLVSAILQVSSNHFEGDVLWAIVVIGVGATIAVLGLLGDRFLPERFRSTTLLGSNSDLEV